MMFLEYLYNLPNATNGIDNIVVQLVTEVPAITPLLLAFVFFTVWMGGVSMQKARTGTADYPMWAVVGSISMFMLALILSLVSGIINLLYLTIVIVVTIFCGIWLFLDHKQGEV